MCRVSLGVLAEAIIRSQWRRTHTMHEEHLDPRVKLNAGKLITIDCGCWQPRPEDVQIECIFLPSFLQPCFHFLCSSLTPSRSLLLHNLIVLPLTNSLHPFRPSRHPPSASSYRPSCPMSTSQISLCVFC